METIHKERLIQMANHLLYGKLGHVKFDFSTINSSCQDACGYAGCAMGEMPVIWSDCWQFHRGTVVNNSHDWNTSDEQIANWFGINERERSHLFEAKHQNIIKYGGTELDHYATKEQVANNIFAFLKKKDPQFEKPQPEEKKVWDLKLVMGKTQEIEKVNAN